VSAFVNEIRSVEDLELEGRRTFIRVDMNCPLTPDGHVADDSRIVAALPTIKLAREAGAKIILCSHLGRPKGRVKNELSLHNVGGRLAELLDTNIVFPDECIGDGPHKLAMNLRDGQVMLLENVRFNPGETRNDDQFVKGLASLAQVYINDAFGTAHRAHASTVGVPRLISERGAGLLMLKELRALSAMMRAPENPFIAVVGGAKVAGKIGVIGNLLGLCDAILVGGAMAHTFAAAQGIGVGSSRVETEKFHLARRVLTKAKSMGVELCLPLDHVVASEIDANVPIDITPDHKIPEGMMGLDIGPLTIAHFEERIQQARTIFWNGPMGVFEIENFARGTTAIANAVARSNGRSVVGGGDSVAAVRQAGVTPFITHISTGGGASLEFLEGNDLPGVEALRSRRKVSDG
jgi:phosphoglycerate kinase